jgi:ribonucleoside-triphosphate reductase (formate)
VLHGFIGERINDVQALKNLVRTICTQYRLPYFTITPTFSVCPECGYLAGEQPTCERCESECEVYSRVVGYLRPVKQWNKGKKQEFIERKTYQVCA